MVELIIGVLAAALLAVIYGLLPKGPGGAPIGTCGDCALSAICKDRQIGENGKAVSPLGDRETCYAQHVASDTDDEC